jgi:hypothetical protein
MSSSFFKAFIKAGRQKELWQSPIPALVCHRKDSMLLAPRFMASFISFIKTFSHRHINSPGSFLSVAFSIESRESLKLPVAFTEIFFLIIEVSFVAMAGAAVRPGD